jgi:hypothetical protein
MHGESSALGSHPVARTVPMGSAHQEKLLKIYILAM